MKNMDIVIPYRGVDSRELDLTIECIQKNVPHRNIFVCGDNPNRDDVIYLPRQHKGVNTYHDCELNTRLALEDPRLSNKFMFFNDDMFVLKPIKSLPLYNAGSLKTIIRLKHRSKRTRLYARICEDTVDFLANRGIKNPKAFTLHMPCVMDKSKRLTVSNEVIPYLADNQRLLVKTVYFSKHPQPSSFKKDVKLYNGDQLDNAIFVSTDNDKLTDLVREVLDRANLPTVHMIWIGSPIPKKYQANIKTYKDLGYRVEVWRRPPPRMVNRELYERVIPYALKADIMRLEILYQNGGIYVDIDSTIKALLPIDGDLVCSTSASGFIANEMIYATKGHPALKKAIDGMDKHIKKLKKCNIWEIAGAPYITPIFKKYPHVKLPKRLVGARTDHPSIIQQQYDGSWSVGMRKSDILPVKGGWLK